MVRFEPGTFEFLHLPTYLTCQNQQSYRLLLYIQVLNLHVHGELRVINFVTLFSYRYNNILNTLRIW